MGTEHQQGNPASNSVGTAKRGVLPAVAILPLRTKATITVLGCVPNTAAAAVPAMVIRYV